MIVDKNRIFDGWRTLEGGVDAGRQPNLLDQNQVQSAINMTFRGGSATTRPGFRKIAEKFAVNTANQLWCFRQRHQYNPSAVLYTYGINHTMGDPGSGHLRTNTADLASTRQIAMSATEKSGQDIGAALRLLQNGQQIFITDQDNTEIYVRYFMTTAPGNHGSWFIFNVRHDTSSGTLPANGATLKVAFPDYGEAKDLFIEGEYKKPSMSLRNPDPPFQPVAPWFASENSESIYRHGIFQCAHAYSPHNGDDCIMALIGGRLFKIVPGVNTAKATEILVEDDPRNLRNMENRSIAYMAQADKFLIAQDGTGGAILYDSNKARRAHTTGTAEQTEVPVGTIMAYGMGRVVVCVNERDIAFGDLYGSHVLPDPADSLIFFTERNFLAEGFDAAIPFSQGKVTGMCFFAQLDTSTGNGQLMAFAERGSASFFMSIPRDQWKTSAFQVLSLLTTGLRGHRTVSVVNEDLWFRSDDGVRSYRQARSEPSGWAHVPLSTNVRQFLENDSDFLLKYASTIYFDNRILCTTSPLWNNGRPYHAGLVVVDFDVISSFAGSAQAPQTSKPAWEGQWKCDRFRPVQLLTGNFDGKTRAFCFGLTDQLDDDGNPVLDFQGNPFQVNQLYEISKDDKDDFVNERIPWELVSKTLDFQASQESTPFTENEVYDGDMWLREIIE